MVSVNNPAGRLHALLSEARARKFQDGERLRKVWGVLLDVDSSDTPLLLSITIQLMSLVQQTRKGVESLENIDKETFLVAVIDVESAFASTNIDTPWMVFAQQISERTMLGLAFCSDRLSGVMGESIIENAVLDELKSEVEAMIDDVLKSDMASPLRAIILDHLESIRRAIVLYKIRGTQGLKEALDSGFGSLARQAAAPLTPADKTLVGRLVDLFAKLDGYVSVAAAVHQLYGRMSEILQAQLTG